MTTEQPPAGRSPAIDQLVASLRAQQGLVAQVSQLQQTNRTMRMMMGAMLALVVLAGAAIIGSYVATQQAREALAAQIELVEQAQLDREVSLLETCRSRNASFRSVRDSLNSILDTIEVQFAPEPSAMIDLRASVPTALDTDRDCTGDGRIGPDDYPANGPRMPR